LLVVKFEGGKVKEAIRVEIGVSVVTTFPFIHRSGSADEVERLVKKFFSIGAEERIRKFGITEYENQLITSDFSGDAARKVEERLKELGNEAIVKKEKDGVMRVKIIHMPIFRGIREDFKLKKNPL